MGTQENLQAVKDGYAAYGRGDIQGVLNLMADDVEWTIPGAGLPVAGIYRGPDGVASFFQKLAAEVEVLEFQPREFLGEGDRVLVTGWERSRVRATNRTIELDWVMSFTLRGGKITRFREFTDTKAIADAYESSAAAAG